VEAKALLCSSRIDMRFVAIGVVTCACFCVLALAVPGAIAGDSNPDGFPPDLLLGLPLFVVGCLGALGYYGLLAASAGALVGGASLGVWEPAFAGR
jgi:uncharacterized RDD family membrane protein YckC